MEYLVQAYDTHHNWLDVDPRSEGYPTHVAGARELLEFVSRTKHGILHDFDAEIHRSVPVAYWVICDDRGTAREVYTTATGRRYNVQPKPQGPGCREPQPVPTIR